MVKLIEGRKYQFLVEKELTLPDNSNHFLVTGPDAKKYLIPAGRYSHYGITPGNVIKCRIDRVNCKGEIFLEPQNPWYSEGKSYSFTVKGTEERTDNSGIKHKVVVVTDKAGSKIIVPPGVLNSFPSRGSKIKLKVQRITKGKLQLEATSRTIAGLSLSAGRNYEFVIERIEKGMDDEDYFVVRDPFGNLHTISRKAYEYYGFSKGTIFTGKVMKHKADSENLIEPVNPFYKPGSVLKMKVTGVTESDVNQSYIIHLRDKYGFNHSIDNETIPEDKTVRCKVVMIKKGKPLFELL
jgi:hypothetical protein